MKQAKRILKIELQRIDDPDPDTSYLGTFRLASRYTVCYRS